MSQTCFACRIFKCTLEPFNNHIDRFHIALMFNKKKNNRHYAILILRQSLCVSFGSDVIFAKVYVKILPDLKRKCLAVRSSLQSPCEDTSMNQRISHPPAFFYHLCKIFLKRYTIPCFIIRRNALGLPDDCLARTEQCPKNT